MTNRGFRDNMMWYCPIQGTNSRLLLVIFCGKEEPQMARVCRTAKEFAEAVKDNEEYITIEGDLKNGVLRIKATGKIAWGVCAGSLAIAITLCIAAGPAMVVPPAGGQALVGGGAAAALAASTLGQAVVPAIAIGVCAGGVGVLNTLRDKYKIIEKNDKYITLKRK